MKHVGTGAPVRTTRRDANEWIVPGGRAYAVATGTLVVAGPTSGGSLPSIITAVTAILVAVSPTALSGQVELCQEAERFVRDVAGMVAVTDPDTIDDWRTRALVPGCRVTAAGATSRSETEEARRFFERLRDAGWGRTPDPRDAPNEAALRFRREGADCLFNFYTSSVALNTEAELVVSDAVPRRPGDTLYFFLVLCTPAAPAAPRG